MLLLAALAEARVAVVAVGSGAWWREGCAAPDPGCLDADRGLAYADDDAWRAGYLLGAFAEPEDVRVLTQPDASTAELSFPGGPPGAPTAEALLAAVEALRPPEGEPLQLLVYIAAHATADEVFLDDGRWPFAGLRERLYAELREGDQLVMITDACLSARWRSGPWGVHAGASLGFPPVDRSPTGIVQIAVDSLTPETPELNGGVLSYLVLSGVIGGADQDGDGTVRAQELSDFIHAYTSAMIAPIAPVVRAPRGVPEWPLPLPSHGVSLLLDRAAPRRWVVRLRDGRVLAEAVSYPGQPRRLFLPAGEYEVLEIPVALSSPDATWRVDGDFATRHVVLAPRAGDHVVVPLDGEPVPVGNFRGEGRSAAATSPVPGPGPRALPRDWSRYHKPSLGRWELAGQGLTGLLPDGRSTWGIELRVSRGPLGAGWIAVDGALQPAMEGIPSQMGRMAVGFGAELALVSRKRADAGLVAGLSLDAMRLQTAAGPQGSIGPSLVLGPAASWSFGGGVGLRAQVAWNPGAWVEALDPASGLGAATLSLSPDLDRVLVNASFWVQP